ncbi:MAG: hypothetical protein PWQ18_256 [Clostridia bacterium]|nr:hypothetical protein [Clostridia bacterium]
MVVLPEPGEQEAPASSRREQGRDVDTSAAEVLGKIEGQLRHSLKALRSLGEDIDDPYVQGTVRRLLQDLRGRQREVTALWRLMERNPELGSLDKIRQRLNIWLQSGHTRSFLWGAGLGILALAVLPAASKGFRPLAVKVVREVMTLADKSQELVAGLKESLEDLVSEAQFEALKQSLEPGKQELPVPGPGAEE